MADNGINQEEFLNSLNTIIKSTFEGKDTGSKVHHKTLETLLNKIESLASKTDGTNVNLDSLVKTIKEEQSKKGSSRSEIGEVTKKLEDKIVELSKKESDLVDAINKQIKSNEDLTEAVKEASAGSKVVGTIPQWTTQAHGVAPQQPGQQGFTQVHGSAINAMVPAQAKQLLVAVEKLGDRIEKTFMGKAFWGKMVGALTDAMFASKMMQNTFTDVIKLGVLMLSNTMRNFFGKQIGGITAILSTIALSVSAIAMTKGLIGLGRGGLSNFARARGLGHGMEFSMRAGLSGVRKTWRGGVKSAKTIATGVASAFSGQNIKKVSKEALKIASGPVGKVTGKALGVLAAVPGIINAGKALGQKDWIGAGGHALAAALPTIGQWAGGFLGGAAGTAVAPGAGTAVGGVAGRMAGLGLGIYGSAKLEEWLAKREKTRSLSTSVSDRKEDEKNKNVGIIARVVSKMHELWNSFWNWIKGGPFQGKGFFGQVWENIKGALSSKEGQAGAEGVQYSSETLKGFDSHKLTSSYKERREIKDSEGKVTGYRHHAGVDLAYNEGDKVPLKVGGKIIAATEISGYGKSVIVDSGDAYQLYGHLSEYGPGIIEAAKNKSALKQGAIIGLAGSTGVGSGPHLHYEVRKKGLLAKNSLGSYSDFLSRKEHHTDPIAWERDKNKVEEEKKTSKPTSNGSIPTPDAPKPEEKSLGEQFKEDVKFAIKAVTGKATEEEKQEFLNRQQIKPTSNPVIGSASLDSQDFTRLLQKGNGKMDMTTLRMVDSMIA